MRTEIEIEIEIEREEEWSVGCGWRMGEIMAGGSWGPSLAPQEEGGLSSWPLCSLGHTR